MGQTPSLNSLVSHEVSGIFWIDGEAFEKRTHFYEPLNYLFDGLLNYYLENSEHKNDLKKMFISQGFNQPYFLCHLDDHLRDKMYEEIINVFQSIKNPGAKRRKILILNSTKNDYLKFFEKKFPNYDYQEIKN